MDKVPRKWRDVGSRAPDRFPWIDEALGQLGDARVTDQMKAVFEAAEGAEDLALSADQEAADISAQQRSG